VHRLRTTARSDDSIEAEEILETLLVEAGVAGQLPTNERKLLQFLGLQQMSFDFMKELEFLTSEKPPGELRAALHLGERVVATQSRMGEKRVRFSVFHEIGHYILPEHLDKLFVDTDQTLSWWTKARLEREANRFAADLLFQGRLFSEEALNLELSLRTVLELAPKYGASYEAAFRRFTENHAMPCALLVYAKVARDDESFVEEDEYSIQYTIASLPFRRIYFSSVQMTEQKCKSSEIYGNNEAARIGQIAEKELTIERHGSEKLHFETEVFSNGYKLFQFIKRPLTTHTKLK
jgi:hypothetical protein